MNFRKNSGNILLSLIISLLVGFSTLTLLALGAHYTQSASTSRKQQTSLNENTFNISLIAEKFRINLEDQTIPLWYPEPYLLELNPNELTKPYIGRNQSHTSSEAAYVPEIVNVPDGKGGEKSFHYEIDSSRMGSLLRFSDFKTLGSEEFHNAFVASGDITQMAQSDLSSFFSLPATSWPTVQSEDNEFGYFKVNQLYFLKYIYDTVTPTLIKGIVVRVMNGTQSTTAEIRVDPPPVPSCQIEVSVVTASSVHFRLRTDSITRKIDIAYDGVNFDEHPRVTAAASVRHLWKYMPATSEISRPIPSNPFPGDAYLGKTRWRILARTWGVDSTQPAKECHLDVAVDGTPASVALFANGSRTPTAIPKCSYPSLHWNVSNVTACKLYSPLGEILWSGNTSGVLPADDFLIATGQFRLECLKANGSMIEDIVTVPVVGPSVATQPVPITASSAIGSRGFWWASHSVAVGYGDPSNVLLPGSRLGSPKTSQPGKIWNSGGYANQWIEIDLGASHQVSHLCMVPEMTPNGFTTQQLLVGNNSPALSFAKTITGMTESAKPIYVSVSAGSFRFFRITTTASPSWVAWHRIKAFK